MRRAPTVTPEPRRLVVRTTERAAFRDEKQPRGHAFDSYDGEAKSAIVWRSASMWCLRDRTSAAAGLILASAVSLLAAAGQSQVPQASGEGLPDGPGKDVTVKACGTCHEGRRAASVRLTREGWAAVIEDMQRRGASVSAQEFPIVLDYLTTHFL